MTDLGFLARKTPVCHGFRIREIARTDPRA